jgi:hypothetical protein
MVRVMADRQDLHLNTLNHYGLLFLCFHEYILVKNVEGGGGVNAMHKKPQRYSQA